MTAPNARFCVGAFNPLAFPNAYFLVDNNLRSTFLKDILGSSAIWVDAQEDTLKEVGWLDDFIAKNVPLGISAVIGIGGGILLNAAPYIAQRRHCDFVSVPTTVLAAADSAIGGLIRLNRQSGATLERSTYKSVYEPSTIILDPRFLETLPETQLRFGLSEVVKHGAYQSLPLLRYLASPHQLNYHNRDDVLKAICWTAALKNVVIAHDPDSLSFGGTILRGGHALARELEEKSDFRISHGEAVAVGVYDDTRSDLSVRSLLDSIYAKLDLPKHPDDLANK